MPRSRGSSLRPTAKKTWRKRSRHSKRPSSKPVHSQYPRDLTNPGLVRSQSSLTSPGFVRLLLQGQGGFRCSRHLHEVFVERSGTDPVLRGRVGQGVHTAIFGGVPMPPSERHGEEPGLDV